MGSALVATRLTDGQRAAAAARHPLPPPMYHQGCNSTDVDERSELRAAQQLHDSARLRETRSAVSCLGLSVGEDAEPCGKERLTRPRSANVCTKRQQIFNQSSHRAAVAVDRCQILCWPAAMLLPLITLSMAHAALESEVAPPSGECRCAGPDVESGKDHGGNDIRAVNVDQHSHDMTGQECCITCAQTPDCEFWQLERGDSNNWICWLKKIKGPVTGDKSGLVVTASLSKAYKADSDYCKKGDSWSMLALLVVGTTAYVVGGMLYGRRVLGRKGEYTDAHPHAAKWRELWGLIMDGCMFAKSCGKVSAARVAQESSADSTKDPSHVEVKTRKKKLKRSEAQKSKRSEGRAGSPLLPGNSAAETLSREWKPTRSLLQQGARETGVKVSTHVPGQGLR